MDLFTLPAQKQLGQLVVFISFTSHPLQVSSETITTSFLPNDSVEGKLISTSL